MSATRVIALAMAGLIALALVPWPLFVIAGLIGFAVAYVRGRIALPVRRRSGAPLNRLVLDRIDEHQLAPLFGDQLPAQPNRQLTAVLDVLEAHARYEQPRELPVLLVRWTCMAGPAPEQAWTSSRVLARYRTVELISDLATGGTRLLTARVTDRHNAWVELTWRIETTRTTVDRILVDINHG
ncbi:hypothetical protein [Conexibacter woesei]|uniref:Uncharacterized protein n=1 Tax=Conexibacter woesei (strain DSM 14684 / CCUG 47730 / CIP 108061 / JCM 11494 / NBRC 100937 / ID131577) TaxID=469383 RepID=D3EZ05_CONWI|nr:hypothetical protein [Conexibacter woesei]ADB49879.1 hypothetical protein Cwoe_1451 [Conexibacter woesei DSM 14684]